VAAIYNGIITCAKPYYFGFASRDYGNLPCKSRQAVPVPTITIGTLEYNAAVQTDQPSRSVISVFTQVYDFIIC